MITDKANSRPRVALVRGPELAGTELQTYDPLLDRFDIHAFGLARHRADLSGARTPHDHLKWPDAFFGRSLMNAYRSRFRLERYFMPGLEKRLEGYAIVQTFEFYTTFSWQVARAKQRLGYRMVVFSTENTFFPGWKDPNTVRKKREIINETDHFIALTKDARQVILAEGVHESRVTVIPYALDLDRFKPAIPDPIWQKRIGIVPGVFTILYVGRLVWEKGVFDILDAVRLMSRRDLCVVFVGNGPERSHLAEYAQLLGLTDMVRFSPHVPYEEIHHLYRLGSVLVLPSLPTFGVREQFGRTLIEAMACGIPVIITRCGSMPEVVGDAGLLCNPGNAGSIADALASLCDFPERRRNLGVRARLLAETLYDRNGVSAMIGQVYETLLKRQ